MGLEKLLLLLLLTKAGVLTIYITTAPSSPTEFMKLTSPITRLCGALYNVPQTLEKSTYIFDTENYD